MTNLETITAKLQAQGSPVPFDSRDRDMIIMSNLSDMQFEIQNGIKTPEELSQKLDIIKGFIRDTRDMF